jgi:hypothetical protein
MKPSPIPERLLQRFDALDDHRRRAAAVAGLLARCHADDLSEDVLWEAARLICAELNAVGDCARRILKEVRR